MQLNMSGRMRRSPADQRPLVVMATAVPVWNFYGFAIDFFRDTWADASIPVIPISYGLNACFVVLLPFLRRGGNAELRVAALLGFAMAVWSAVGMAFSPASKLVYSAVPTVLGAATAGLAISALSCRRRADARRHDAPSPRQPVNAPAAQG